MKFQLYTAPLALALIIALCAPFMVSSAGAGSGSARSLFSTQERTLSFYNTHTRETVQEAIYWRNGRYQHSGLEQIAHNLRDHRREESREMEPTLLDLLWSIKAELKARYPQKEIVFHVISGYRSPETNAMMRASGGGQAKKSRHMHGDAIDIRVPGVKLSELRDIAWCRQAGGVGYYKGSDFIHIDTHRVRFWHWKPSGSECGQTNSSS